MTESSLSPDLMFDPEKRHAEAQAAADAAVFEATRPVKRDDGRVYAPLTGNIIDPDEYFESQRAYRIKSRNLPYDELPTTAIIEKMGDAEAYNDITTLTDAEEVLAEKLADKNLSATELARQLAFAEFHDSSLAASVITDTLVDKLIAQEKAIPTNPKETTQDRNARSDNLVNLILKVKDREIERLQSTVSEPERQPEPDAAAVEIEDQAQPEEAAPESDAAAEAGNQVYPEEVTPEPEIVADQEANRLASSEKVIRYENDEHTHSYALEYSEPGTRINWQDNPWAQGQDREILLTDENGHQLYVKGPVIYDLSASLDQQAEVSWEDEDLTQLSPVVIGEGWKLTDDYITPPIRSVRVRYTPEDEPEFVHESSPGTDPFNDAAAALAAVSFADPEGQPYQGFLPPSDTAPQQNNQLLMGEQPVDSIQEEPAPAAISSDQYFAESQPELSRRERLRNWWAARRAGGLALGGTTVTRTREWFNDDPTGRRRKTAIAAGAIVGAAVVIGLAYLAAKGLFSVEEHHPKGHNQPTHTGTTPTRTGVPDTTPAAPAPSQAPSGGSQSGSGVHHHYHVHGLNASKHIARYGDTTSYAGRLGHSGSTIWGNEELRIRHFHPDWSQQRVYHAANWMSRHILHLNHLTETQAEDLPVNFRYAR